jgi:hypothetical protein
VAPSSSSHDTLTSEVTLPEGAAPNVAPLDLSAYPNLSAVTRAFGPVLPHDVHLLPDTSISTKGVGPVDGDMCAVPLPSPPPDAPLSVDHVQASRSDVQEVVEGGGVWQCVPDTGQRAGQILSLKTSGARVGELWVERGWARTWKT